MSEQIVAVSVDKIQTFLTEVIHSHVQEKQTEDATLRGIINSSYQISNDFYKDISDIFPEESNEMILKCSGVYIFRCAFPEQEIEERLNKLFTDCYRQSQGQKLIRWAYFTAGTMDDLTAIKKAKRSLKQAKNWNEIIEKNQDLLFSFCQVQENGNEKPRMNQEEFPQFSKDINALYREEEKKQKEKNRFRIAVIKADLDGMGAMFNKVQECGEYTNISNVLNEEISLKGLHRAAQECCPAGKMGWLFPLYIAGDDIFFAVAVEDLICGINVCRNIMREVKKRIKEKGSTAELGISVGVEITFNRQPIRYYMDMVEAQLKNAKLKSVPEALNEFFIMKISIANLTFFDINYQGVKKEKKKLKCNKQNCKCEKCKKRLAINQQLQNTPIWSFFLSDVRLLNYIRSDEKGCAELLGTPNFFYTLLEDITDEAIQSDDVKYINHILYHLIPNYFEENNQRVGKMELLLNSNLIKQLYQKDKKGTKIVLNRNTKERFEKYLRLMLLFGDDRFEIGANEQGKVYEARYDENKKEVYRNLFGQPREYLYQHCLEGQSRELTNIFVKKVRNDPGKPCKAGYKKIILETSMLFRLRNVDFVPICKAAEMIEQRNQLTWEEIEALNAKRKDEEKLPNRLYFNKGKFCTIAERTKAWSPDFIDSLMLFYQYNEMAMKFRKTDFK